MGGQAATPVTDQMIENDAASTGDVLSWGIGQQGQRYSPLKTVNTTNVDMLLPVWSFSFGGEKQRGQKGQPVIHNGKMFVTASYSRIFALDAKTGAKLWKYAHCLPDGIMPCCDVINRGAALCDNLVIFATLDAELVALNQDTGEVVWKEEIDDYAAGYSASAAPLIAQGLLLTGVTGGEFGVVGRVEARDPKTGKMVWSRPVVEGHMGKRFDKDGKESDNGVSGTAGKTWPGNLWKTGGAASWLGGAYNTKTGLACFGTGNPSPWNSRLRKGDNLFSTSTVAIDLKTGRPNFIPEGRPGDPTAGAAGKKGNVVFAAPPFLGGKNQMPMAYSPDTTLFYVPANEWGMELWNEPVTYQTGAACLGAGFTTRTLSDGPIGALRAVDPKTGKIVWEAPNNAPLCCSGQCCRCATAFTQPARGRPFDERSPSGGILTAVRTERNPRMSHASTARRVFMLRAVAATSLFGTAATAQTQTKVDEADETAVGLGYKHDTTKGDAKKYPQHKAGQKCTNCQFWQGSPTDVWAGCSMFGRKQIAAGGWCLAYKTVG